MVKHIILNDDETTSFNKAKAKILTDEPLNKLTDAKAVKKMADKYMEKKK